jgi:hypothetical protein
MDVVTIVVFRVEVGCLEEKEIRRKVTVDLLAWPRVHSPCIPNPRGFSRLSAICDKAVTTHGKIARRLTTVPSEPAWSLFSRGEIRDLPIVIRHLVLIDIIS